MNKKIMSLEALRGIAFLGVFLCHYNTDDNRLACLGGWAVSIFLILNGFVMIYSYYGKNRISNVSFKQNLLFAKRKIQKLYILHVICTMAMVPFMLLGNEAESVTTVLIKILLNLLLIQAWFPIEGIFINGVSWYLCVIVFSYFLFPYILDYIEKGYSIKKAIRMIFICLIIMISIALLGLGMSVVSSNHNILWMEYLSHTFVYNFPLSRMWDIIIGINLGYIFINYRGKMVKRYCTYGEICGVLLAVIANVCVDVFVKHPSNSVADRSWFAPECWYGYAFVFIYCIGAMILVYSFAHEKGVISCILTNKITLYLARISPYAFLIHLVVFRYLAFILYRFPVGIIASSNQEALRLCSVVNLTIGFVITVILSEICIYVNKKVQHFS